MPDGSIISKLSGKRVVVIGDVVADQYLNGTISRVSREAPVFILRHDETITLPGAAANAAANIASLGGIPTLIGVLGGDVNATLLRQALEKAGVGTASIAVDSSAATTTKQRVLASHTHAVRQQVIRIDFETSVVSDEANSFLRRQIDEHLPTADAVIVSDYGYGVVNFELFAAIRDAAKRHRLPLVVDSRSRLGVLVGATAATPNQDEVEQLLQQSIEGSDREELRERLGVDALLITKGNKGMELIEHGKPINSLHAVGSLEPVDVTGAGDTVIAAFTLALAAGISYADSACIANHAGGIVVMKRGTATASAAELAESLNSAGLTAAEKNA